MTTSLRLTAAAALCVVSLGLAWGATSASTGYVTPGMILPTTYVSPLDGTLTVSSIYLAGEYVDGDPLRAARGAESDVRAVLVPAAAVLGVAAHRRTSATRRMVQVAVVALAVVAVVGAARGMVQGALPVAVAVVLVAPVLRPWPARPRWGPGASIGSSLGTRSGSAGPVAGAEF